MIMFKPVPMHEARAGYYIESYGAALHVHLGRYVLRIGKPWSRYRYAWQPLFSFYRCFK